MQLYKAKISAASGRQLCRSLGRLIPWRTSSDKRTLVVLRLANGSQSSIGDAITDVDFCYSETLQNRAPSTQIIASPAQPAKLFANGVPHAHARAEIVG
jgi:hypothetical protein